ncbi:Zinc finger protein 844 [Frankliniella fusca]|uniref:Zinc finger protein 844 n=1 Tax=Frankliniella fusca TaxID=407009 RepID=A0AAE1L9S8_9NEOP|nr:Zinc finger protein 844 [Frankliniella fusca]
MPASPWRSKRREDLRKRLEEAVTKEVSVIKVGYNFLPADQLRGKALANLGIPSSLGGKINWNRIGPNFSFQINPTRALQYVVPSYDRPRKFFKSRLPRGREEQQADVGPKLIRRQPQPAAAAATARKDPVSAASGKTRDTVRKVNTSKTATREESSKEVPAAPPAAVSGRRRPSKRVLFREESEDKGPSVTPVDTPSSAAQSRVRDGAGAGAAASAHPLAEAFEPPSSPEDLNQARSRPITLGILGTKQKKPSKTTRDAMVAKAQEMTKKLLQRGRSKSPRARAAVEQEEAAALAAQHCEEGDNTRHDTHAPVGDRTWTSAPGDEARPAELAAEPDRGRRPDQTEDAPPPAESEQPEQEHAPLAEQQTNYRDSANVEDEFSAPAPAAGQQRCDAVDFTMTFRKTAGPPPSPSPATPRERPMKRKSLSLAKKKRLSRGALDAADENSPTAAKRSRAALSDPRSPRSPRSPRTPRTPRSTVLSQKQPSSARPSPTLLRSPDICSAKTILRSASPSPTRTPIISHGTAQPGVPLQTSSPIIRPSFRKPTKIRVRRSQNAEARPPRDITTRPQNASHAEGSPATSSPAPLDANDSDSSDVIRPSQYVHAPAIASPAPLDANDSDSSDVIRPSQYVHAPATASPAPLNANDSDSSDVIRPSQYVHAPATSSPAPLNANDSDSSDVIRPSQYVHAPATSSPAPLNANDSDSSDVIRPSQYVHAPATSSPVPLDANDSDLSDVIQPSQYVHASATVPTPLDPNDSDSSEAIQALEHADEPTTPALKPSDSNDSDSSDFIKPSEFVHISPTPASQRPEPSDSNDSDSSDFIKPSQFVHMSPTPASQRPDDSDAADVIQPSQYFPAVLTKRSPLDKLGSSSPAGRSPAVPSGGRRRREGSSSGTGPSQLSDQQRRERERLARQLFEAGDTEAEEQDGGRGEDDEMSNRTPTVEDLAGTSVGGLSRMSVGRVSPEGLQGAAQHVSLREAAERALLARGSAAASRVVSGPSSGAASRTPSSRRGSGRGSSFSSPRRRAEEARIKAVASDSDSEETLRARERARRSRRSRELIRRNSPGEVREAHVEHQGEAAVAAVAARRKISQAEVSVRVLPGRRGDRPVIAPTPPVYNSSSDGGASSVRWSVSVASISIPCGTRLYQPPQVPEAPPPQKYYDSTASELDEAPQTQARRPTPLFSPPLVRRPPSSTTATTTTTTEGSTVLESIAESVQQSSEAASSEPGPEGASSVSRFSSVSHPEHFADAGIAPRPPGPRWSRSVESIPLNKAGGQEAGSAPRPPGPRWSRTLDSIALPLNKAGGQEAGSAPRPPGPRWSRSVDSIPLPLNKAGGKEAESAPRPPGPRWSRTVDSIPLNKAGGQEAESAPRPPGPRWSRTVDSIPLNKAGGQEAESAPCPPGSRWSRTVDSIPLPLNKAGGQEAESAPRPPGPRWSRSIESILLTAGSGQERYETVATPVPGRRQSQESFRPSHTLSTWQTPELHRADTVETRTPSSQRIPSSAFTPRGRLEESSKNESDLDLDLGSDVELDFDDLEDDTDEESVAPTPTAGHRAPTTRTPGRAPPRTRYNPDRGDTAPRNLFETPRRQLEQVMNPKRIHMSSAGRLTSPPPQDPRDESLSSTQPLSASTQRTHREFLIPGECITPKPRKEGEPSEHARMDAYARALLKWRTSKTTQEVGGLPAVTALTLHRNGNGHDGGKRLAFGNLNKIR